MVGIVLEESEAGGDGTRCQSFYADTELVFLHNRYYSPFYDLSNQIYCYIRESNGKVFINNGIDTTDYLWYDFTLNIGNEFSVWSANGGAPIQYTMSVDAIDSVQLLNGEWRKRWIFSEASPSCAFPLCNCTDTFKIIEGIGSVRGFFYENIYACYNHVTLARVTKLSDGTTLYGSPCIFMSGIKEKGREQTMQIFPNPSSSEISISFSLPEENETSVSIYDLTGKQVLYTTARKINDVDPIQLNVQDLNSGIYIVKMVSPENTVVKRFSKN
jgi:hypothetical protein